MMVVALYVKQSTKHSDCVFCFVNEDEKNVSKCVRVKSFLGNDMKKRQLNRQAKQCIMYLDNTFHHDYLNQM